MKEHTKRDILMQQIKKIAYPSAVLLVMLILLASCSSSKKSDSNTVATWDENSLTVEQFKDRLISIYGSIENAKRLSLSGRLENLDSYLNSQLLLEEAKQRGIDKRTSVLLCCAEKIHTLQLKVDETRDKEVANLVSRIFVNDRVITEELLKDFWEHDQFEMRARHLLVYIPPEATGNDTLEYWQKIQNINQLVQSGNDFNALVDKYSDDKSMGKSLHGDLGYFRWGRMVDEFQDVVWSLEVGQISDIVRSEFGYHIIQLIDKRPLNIQYDTSHILIACSQRADKAETTLAYDRAMMVLEKAVEKGADFVELARAYSEDQGTWANGRVGFNPIGKMHENYWEALHTMKKGDVKGPVRSSLGYHIIKLHDIKTEEIPLSDPDERQRISLILNDFYKEALDSAGRAFADSIMKTNEVAYSQEGLLLFCKVVNSPELLDDMSINQFSKFSEAELKTKIVEDKFRSITIGDIVNRYQSFNLPAKNFDEMQLKAEIIEPYLWEYYIKDIAKSLDLNNNPKVIEAVRLSTESLLMLELDYEMLLENVQPTEKEIEDYYQKYFVRGQVPELVEPLESKRDEIIRSLRYAQLDEVKASELKKLRSKYDLKINNNAVKKIWHLIEPLPQAVADERLALVSERRKIGKEAKQKRKEANEIQMPITPGATQTFQRDGKEIKVKFGEPRPVDKKDENGDPTSRVKQSKSDPDKNIIELKPKKKDK